MDNVIGYQICRKCILDSTIDNISFDSTGVCNYCNNYQTIVKNDIIEDELKRNEVLQQIISRIETHGKNRKYNCIIGLSGGVDSTYVAWLVAKHGLRPLAVHLDNGWNSETAVRNIHNTVEKLRFDLYTHVIDWEEFKDLQLSFFKAGVVDLEMLTDHAISAIMLDLARKERIKYFINGFNIVTEAVMPDNWSYAKWDQKNILSIHKIFGEKTINSYPTYGFIGKLLRQYYYKNICILNYIDYNKEDAKKIISSELGWKDYGGKHFESVFTKFYQSYYLPVKFNIDKRKAHLSNLICSGQMTRDKALELMMQPILNEEEQKDLVEYVIKKWDLNKNEFDRIMLQKGIPHEAYPNGQKFNNFLKSIKKVIRIEKND